MMKRSLKNRFLPLLLSMAFVAAGARSLHAHAGHSHGPEPEAPKLADVPPRFYAQSEGVEVILAFPPAGETGDPTLYVASKANNIPVDGATVVADILSGSKAKIKVAEGSTSGSYVLQGLGIPETTVSLTVEISKGDLLEILSMDNILPATMDESKTATASAGGYGGGEEKVFGLPRYLMLALVAMNGVLVAVVLLSFMIWVGKMMIFRRKGKVRSIAADRQTVSSGAGSTGKISLLVAAASLFMVGNTPDVWAHAGEDHSGASLAVPPGTSASSLHFLAINAQFEGDVRTTQVVERTLPKSFRALGQVEIRPDLKAVVTPPVEGKLLLGSRNNGRVPVQGEEVKNGDVLVVVEQIIQAAEKVTLTTERAQVEAELGQARQELALATRERGRADRLVNVIAAQDVDKARANQKIAQDKVNGLVNRLQTLTSALSSGGGGNVRQIPIVSPISGTVTQSHAVLGEYVRNDKTLFEIVNVDEVFVGADVFETDLALLRNAKSARITLEAYPGESFSGTLHSVGQEINSETRTARVLFAVTNPEQKLRGGMFANIEIESGTPRKAVVVPKGAVISEDGVRQVYKKVAPETFQAQIVTVSEFREDVAVITEGLQAGDRVAVSGLYQVRKAPTVPVPASMATAEGSSK